MSPPSKHAARAFEQSSLRRAFIFLCLAFVFVVVATAPTIAESTLAQQTCSAVALVAACMTMYIVSSGHVHYLLSLVCIALGCANRAALRATFTPLSSPIDWYGIDSTRAHTDHLTRMRTEHAAYIQYLVQYLVQST